MKSNLKIKTIILIALGIFVAFSTLHINFNAGNIDEINLDTENIKLSAISGKIHIANNWSDAKTAGICTGFGTWSDPYVIEDLIINGENTEYCILIENSIEFCRIENCTLYNTIGSWGEGGIHISNSQNGIIFNNEMSDHHSAILLENSNNFTIIENIVNDNSYGVRLENAHNNRIINNTANFNHDGIYIDGNNNVISENSADDNDQAGITLSDMGNNVTLNTMEGCGIVGDSSTNNIDTTNLVNGKPVYYYYNKNGLGSNNFTNAGQVILTQCSNSMISNLNINDATRAITLRNCINITISNCIVSNNVLHGILLIESDDNTIISCTASNGEEEGILLYNGCNNNTVIGNDLSSNHIGLSLYSNCDINEISENVMDNNIINGMQIDHSDNNTISFNSVSNTNNYAGIIIDTGSHNIFYGNTIRDNNGSYSNIGFNIRDSDSQNNKIFKNYFIDNGINAKDNGTNNAWDNGTIGNYWQDYTGKDTDDDGIGDVLYIINNTNNTYANQDNYPIWWDPPVININSPYLYVIYENSPNFNITIKEGIADTMWYTLDAGLSSFIFSNTTGKIDPGFWNKKEDGIVSISFSVNDSRGIISNAIVSVIKDTLPKITIHSPVLNEMFESTAPSFNITIEDLSPIITTWYTIDGGLNNYTFTGSVGSIRQLTWDNAPIGDVIIIFYARDLLGYIGTNSVLVKKDIQIADIPGYNLFILLGILSVVVILVSKKLKKS